MKWIKFLLYPAAFVLVFSLAAYVTMRVAIREEGTVVCPDVAGKDLGEAKNLLEQKGLGLVVARYERRKDVQYNRILFQKPDALMAVKIGRTVSVIVSEGPLPVTIPLVIDHSLTYAENVLQERNIPIRKIIYVPHEDQGKVLAQVPRNGENILDEGGMTLVVGAREKDYFLMPPLVGKNYFSVIEELDRKQIAYKMVQKTEVGRPMNTILEASVPPKALFPSDETIELKVNAGG